MRLIDADEFFKDFCESEPYEHISHEYDIDAEPIRHGKWIWEEQVYKCSECSHKAYGNILECMDGTYKFCPVCGARMEETDEAY